MALCAYDHEVVLSQLVVRDYVRVSVCVYGLFCALWLLFLLIWMHPLNVGLSSLVAMGSARGQRTCIGQRLSAWWRCSSSDFHMTDLTSAFGITL